MPVMYSSGGSSASLYRLLAPNPATMLAAKAGNKQVQLTWTDPEDREEWPLTAKWGYSVLIRKQGSAPTSVSDGTKVVESSVKNQYQNEAYVDTKVENGIEYFYAVYTYSTDGEISLSAPTANATPKDSIVMTVVIDLNDSNPETCSSYADNAVDMPYGMTEEAVAKWQEFFGYRPCLFKDGQVVGYLNPNDYSKFEDGTSADIYSGKAGDVMVEFPRKGVSISKSGKIITVSMTDSKDDPDFTYYAHTRGENRREYFYVSAYVCSHVTLYNDHSFNSVSGDGILSAATPEAQDALKTIEKHYTPGYGIMSFYQLVYIQVMYLLQFRGNLNSQKAFAHGYSYSLNSTGDLDTSGLCYGVPSDHDYGLKMSKLFGMENFYMSTDINASVNQTHVAGIQLDESFTIYTTTDPTRSNHVNYKQTFVKHKRYFSAKTNGYISDVVASSELGFLPTALKGSKATFFSDIYALNTVNTYNDYPYDLGPDGIFSSYMGGLDSDEHFRLLYL